MSKITNEAMMLGQVTVIKERKDPITGEMYEVERQELKNSLHPECIKNAKDVLKGKACFSASSYTADAVSSLLVSFRSDGELFDEESRMDAVYAWQSNHSGSGEQVYVPKHDVMIYRAAPSFGVWQIKLANPIEIGGKEELGVETDEEAIKLVFEDNSSTAGIGAVLTPDEQGKLYSLKSSYTYNVQFTPKSNMKEGSKVSSIGLYNFRGFSQYDLTHSTTSKEIATMEEAGIRIIKGATPLTKVALNTPIEVTSTDYLRVIYKVTIVINIFLDKKPNQYIFLNAYSSNTNEKREIRRVSKALVKGEWANYINYFYGHNEYVGSFLGRLFYVPDKDYDSVSLMYASGKNKHTYPYLLTNRKELDTENGAIPITEAPENVIYPTDYSNNKYSSINGGTVAISRGYLTYNLLPHIHPLVVKYDKYHGALCGSTKKVMPANTSYEWEAKWIGINNIGLMPLRPTSYTISIDLYERFDEPIDKTRYNQLDLTLVHNKAIVDGDYENFGLRDMTKEEEELYEV